MTDVRIALVRAAMYAPIVVAALITLDQIARGHTGTATVAALTGIAWCVLILVLLAVFEAPLMQWINGKASK